MVGDGIVPQNEGRGYVLRRLLRRAARHGRLLGIGRPFLHEVCDTVIRENAAAYPQLTENAEYIKTVIRTEEERFSKTIEQGMELLSSIIDRMERHLIHGRHQIPGDQAFKLYDTFGFPLDLTKEIAADKGFEVDEEGFLSFMKRQREQAQKAWQKAHGGAGWEEDVLARQQFEDRFIGYSELKTNTKILFIVQDGELVSTVRDGGTAAIFLEATPFYAESGGQVGDTGIINAGKSIFRVTDCKKSPTGHYMHIGRMESGFFATGDAVSVAVDKKRRRAIMRNHTAAHLLQAALREVLGAHVHQAGQLVDNKTCRFDFTHFSAVTPAQLAQVEDRVNDLILQALPVQVGEMPMAEAKAQGALALFGDKYSDVVRVCNIAGASVELCGGTHAGNTSRLGLFKILHETSVAAGVRRIEAVTGTGVLELIRRQEAILAEAGASFKLSAASELPAKCAAAAQQIRELQRQVEQLSEKLTASQASSLLENLPRVGAVQVLTATLPGATPESLRATADKLKDRAADLVGVLAATGGEKTTLLAFCGKDALSAGIHCGKLVQAVAKTAGGSGGGRPDSAMGGITDSSRLEDALGAVAELVREQQ